MRSPFILIFFFCLLSLSSKAQNYYLDVSGTASITVGGTGYYSAEFRSGGGGEAVVPPDGTFSWYIFSNSGTRNDMIIQAEEESLAVHWTEAGSYYVQYRLESYDGENSWSGGVSVQVLPPLPPAPTSIWATGITTSSFVANWNHVPQATTGYILSIYANPPAYNTLVGSYYLPAGSTSYQVSNLNNERYAFRVYSRNETGTTGSYLYEVTLPPLPPTTMQVVSILPYGFTVQWQGQPSATGYVIRVSTNPAFPAGNVETFSTTNVQYLISGRTPSTLYYIQVQSLRNSISSDFTPSVTARTLPAAPTALPATNLTGNSFVAHWTAIAGILNYVVEVSKREDFHSSEMIYTNLMSSTNQVIVQNLPERRRYYYRVRSYNGYAYSNYSNVMVTPTLDVNYVKTIVPQSDIYTSVTSVSENIGEAIVSVDYVDGLGRVMQRVSKQSSPQAKDIVQPVLYDQYGRPGVQLLPVATGTDGWFKRDIVDAATKTYQGEAASFYSTPGLVAADLKPYAKTVYDHSPLNRIVKQGAPGVVWQPNESVTDLSDKVIKKKYELNSPGEVLYFIYDQTTATLLPSHRFYPAHALYKNVTLDEANHETVEFVDKQGKTVAKKVEYKTENGAKQYTSTYYIYDDSENLVVVLPPEAIRALPVAYGNARMSATFTRSNCGANTTPASIEYVVEAYTHAGVTQQDADALAQADIAANGQAFADSEALCRPIYFNKALAALFYYQGCPCGFEGAPVVYTVPANTYSSGDSQAAADAQAQAALNINGQIQANAEAKCNPTCLGSSRRLIGCDCMEGTKTFVTSELVPGTSIWRCYFYYEWPGGQTSEIFSEVHPNDSCVQDEQ